MIDLTLISEGNKALEFIQERVEDPNYRGESSSQHNRYNIEEIFQTLKILSKYNKEGSLLRIRTSDLSKRPENIPEERRYAEFCNEVIRETGKGTQDSIRKNLFVDWHRMGFITRYNKQKKEVNPWDKGTKMYVSLTELGRKFIDSDSTEITRAYLFSKAVNILQPGIVEATLQVLDELHSEKEGVKNKRLNFYEFMFFVTAVNNYDYGITVSKCIELIKEYRYLTKHQISHLLIKLKEMLTPSNYDGNKVSKRDFHNWENKNRQMWHLFEEVVFFIVDGDFLELYTKGSNKEVKGDFAVKKMKRSPVAKRDYFEKHGINKVKGFELDHIIPLMSAKSISEFAILDDWKNLLYIGGTQHNIKTQTNSRYQVLEVINKKCKIALHDLAHIEKPIILLNGDNVFYKPELIDEMERFNKEFLDECES